MVANIIKNKYNESVDIRSLKYRKSPWDTVGRTMCGSALAAVYNGYVKMKKLFERRMKMVYAIEMYFDKETEKKIMCLAQKIADAGLSTKFLDWKTRPHVTLAVFNDVDESRCSELLAEFAGRHKAFPAFLDSVSMFNDTKTIFLSPTMTRGMYDLQSELHRLMEEFDANGWEWYRPDGWVPHCTVALTKDDEENAFFEASNLVLHEFKKIQGLYVSVGLVKITFPVEELAVFDFEV